MTDTDPIRNHHEIERILDLFAASEDALRRCRERTRDVAVGSYDLGRKDTLDVERLARAWSNHLASDSVDIDHDCRPGCSVAIAREYAALQPAQPTPEPTRETP